MPYQPPPLPPTRREARQSAQTRAHSRSSRHARRTPRPADVRRARRCALALLYAALILEIGAALLTSPVFAIKRVQARGLETLPASEAAQVLHASAFAPGTSWLRPPFARLEQRLRALPWVRDAQATRQFPNTVALRVIAREPCVVAQSGAQFFEMDVDGTPIRPARPGSLARWPLVTLQRPYPLRFGVALDDAALRAAIHAVQFARSEPLLRIAKIEVDQSDNLCLNMRDGLPIHFGQTEDFDAKLALLRGIYTRRPDVARTLAAVDLSSPNAPACILRGALPAAVAGPAETSAAGSAETNGVESGKTNRASAASTPTKPLSRP